MAVREPTYVVGTIGLMVLIALGAFLGMRTTQERCAPTLAPAEPTTHVEWRIDETVSDAPLEAPVDIGAVQPREHF